MNQSDNPAAIDVIHSLIRATHYIQREFETQLSTLSMPFQLSGPRLRLLITISSRSQAKFG